MAAETTPISEEQDGYEVEMYYLHYSRQWTNDINKQS